jgi:rRNA maturation RNase YbeY
MSTNINFFFEEVKKPALDFVKIKRWLCLLIRMYRFELINLNYILCSDDYLLEINREYLGHDYYTDIITFDNSDQSNHSKEIEGDIFISLERIEENAFTHKSDHTIETLRVISHGVLHLVGHKDKTEKEQLEMRSKEKEAITLYFNK